MVFRILAHSPAPLPRPGGAGPPGAGGAVAGQKKGPGVAGAFLVFGSGWCFYLGRLRNFLPCLLISITGFPFSRMPA